MPTATAADVARARRQQCSSRLEQRLRLYQLIEAEHPGFLSRGLPKLDYRPMDLYGLYQAVLRLGGFERVVKAKRWMAASRALCVAPIATSASNALRAAYSKYLVAVERKQENELKESTSRGTLTSIPYTHNTSSEAHDDDMDEDTDASVSVAQQADGAAATQDNLGKRTQSPVDTFSINTMNSSYSTGTKRQRHMNEAQQMTVRIIPPHPFPQDLPSEMESATPVPGSSTGRSSTSKSRKNKEVLPKEFGRFCHSLRKQELGAVSVGFHPRAVMPVEINSFPEFGENCTPENRVVYLEYRNHILQKWTANVGEELELNAHVIDPLEREFGEEFDGIDWVLLMRVFAFLDTSGFINTGVFKRTQEISSHWVLPSPQRKANGTTVSSSAVSQKHIVIIGAGLSGLTAANHLERFGYRVTVIEANERVGGRVLTDRSFGNGEASVDVGAMLITGHVDHPCEQLRCQLGLDRHLVLAGCPLIADGGQVLSEEVDVVIESRFNEALDMISEAKQRALRDEESRLGHVVPETPMTAGGSNEVKLLFVANLEDDNRAGISQNVTSTTSTISTPSHNRERTPGSPRSTLAATANKRIKTETETPVHTSGNSYNICDRGNGHVDNHSGQIDESGNGHTATRNAHLDASGSGHIDRRPNNRIAGSGNGHISGSGNGHIDGSGNDNGYSVCGNGDIEVSNASNRNGTAETEQRNGINSTNDRLEGNSQSNNKGIDAAAVVAAGAAVDVDTAGSKSAFAIVDGVIKNGKTAGDGDGGVFVDEPTRRRTHEHSVGNAAAETNGVVEMNGSSDTGSKNKKNSTTPSKTNALLNVSADFFAESKDATDFAPKSKSEFNHRGVARAIDKANSVIKQAQTNASKARQVSYRAAKLSAAVIARLKEITTDADIIDVETQNNKNKNKKMNEVVSPSSTKRKRSGAVGADRGRFGLGTLQEMEDMSLLDGIFRVFEYRRWTLDEEGARVLSWHIANVEYGCAVTLDKLSLMHWDQDDDSAFQGQHLMFPQGFGSIAYSLAARLNASKNVTMMLGTPVKKVVYNKTSNSDTSSVQAPRVTVHYCASDVVHADAVIVSTSLGCLQREMIEFEPKLPTWKSDAIHRLGFGNLNKVVLEFEERFWDNSHDMFGRITHMHSRGIPDKPVATTTASATPPPDDVVNNESSMAVVDDSVNKRADVPHAAKKGTSISPPVNETRQQRSGTKDSNSADASQPTFVTLKRPRNPRFGNGEEEIEAEIAATPRPQPQQSNAGVSQASPGDIAAGVSGTTTKGGAFEIVDTRGESYMFSALDKVTGKPILMTLFAGQAAHDVEANSDQEAVDRTMQGLRSIFDGPNGQGGPNCRVPQPVHTTVTRWGQDPYIGGSYSYIPVGSTGLDYDILAAPVDDCVLFAGEATNREHPATTGGAVLSGMREAARVVSMFGRLLHVPQERVAQSLMIDEETSVTISMCGGKHNVRLGGAVLSSKNTPGGSANTSSGTARTSENTGAQGATARSSASTTSTNLERHVGFGNICHTTPIRKPLNVHQLRSLKHQQEAGVDFPKWPAAVSLGSEGNRVKVIVFDYYKNEASSLRASTIGAQLVHTYTQIHKLAEMVRSQMASEPMRTKSGNSRNGKASSITRRASGSDLVSRACDSICRVPLGELVQHTSVQVERDGLVRWCAFLTTKDREVVPMLLGEFRDKQTSACAGAIAAQLLLHRPRESAGGNNAKTAMGLRRQVRAVLGGLLQDIDVQCGDTVVANNSGDIDAVAGERGGGGGGEGPKITNKPKLIRENIDAAQDQSTAPSARDGLAVGAAAEGDDDVGRSSSWESVVA